jgi:hypothetical protein
MSSPAHPGQPPVDDFVPIEELIRQQRVRPLASIDDLVDEDPFGSDEEHAEFLTDLYASRRAGS